MRPAFENNIFEYDRRLERTFAAMEKNEKIPEVNKKLILSFSKQCALDGLSKARVEKYVRHLYQIARWVDKEFLKMKRKDVENLVATIEERPYSEWTKHDFKITIKKFFRFIKKSEDNPPEVKWIKMVVRNRKTKIPEELLTEEDIGRLIETADHPRNRALVAMLYESGCRCGELLSLQIKHIQFDEHGCRITVDGKTGMRRVMLISSTPLLTRWLEIHPRKDDAESPVWTSIGVDKSKNQNNLTYTSFAQVLKRLAKKAGIKKRVHPHLFRHSRATFLANHLTEFQMNQYFGWVQGSDMPATYVHMSGREIDGALLELHGIKQEEKKTEPKMSIQKCPVCAYDNAPNSKFCGRCARPLSLNVVLEVEEKRKVANRIIDRLASDPEGLKALAKAMSKLGLIDEVMSL
jgi:site-specific recombinase XerD